MPSIFSRIISGEIPCHKVAEDDRYFAFLDINPLQEGHTLVVPKVEVDRLFDLDDEILAGMLPFAKGVARRISSVVPCNRVGVAVIGLEVPHAHIHLIPINSERDMDFSAPKLKLTQDQLAAMAERLRNG
ncbi:MAG: HIT family protein [Flavobacteriales bacterium]|nr:HIT family protein [Flavobacteriales bacterium]MBK6946593.1 HIT family protein [Flavobacteriales bacterium]MBK7239670.1 HIT family protein [Flavobacteriales bacterium]MBK7298691.1 HIT family protein [Flavobacteriales bacterium]MBK9536644.1 HIT family protein [Flavobacteriales bacterium]